MIRISVEKKPNESTSSVVRRFTKKVQAAGIIKVAKNLRFRQRPQSEYVKKQSALKRIQKQKERERLYKLGKINGPYHR